MPRKSEDKEETTGHFGVFKNEDGETRIAYTVDDAVAFRFKGYQESEEPTLTPSSDE